MDSKSNLPAQFSHSGLPLDVDRVAYEHFEKQHLTLRKVLGKYPPILGEVMKKGIPGETKACLDLGCGSGGWIMEVARDFPDCRAVGVDLHPMQSTLMPPNCWSEVDDINLGLEHCYDSFDVVHARLISSGVKDFRSLIDQISRVLRPGGLIYVAELDLHIYDSDKQRLKVDTNTLGPPWVARWMEHAKAAIRQRGGNTETSSNIFQWVRMHGAFDNVVCEEIWLPTSPCAPKADVQQNHIGELVRENIMLAQLKFGRSLFAGLPNTLVDELEDNTVRELMDARLPQYLRLQVVYALKKASK